MHPSDPTIQLQHPHNVLPTVVVIIIGVVFCFPDVVSLLLLCSLLVKKKPLWFTTTTKWN